MSDNMERDKTEFTAKEREVEEMKQELLGMRMYESWYTYKDMKEILGVINESKNMANIGNDEKNVQKELLHSSSNYTRHVMPKANLTQELETQERNDTSQSIRSYKPNRTSPMREQICAHGCSSSNLEPVITESRNSKNMFVKSQDNLNIRDSYARVVNRCVPLKSKNSSQDSDIMHNIDMKMDTHSEREQKLDRWQINPLDSYVSENDVPLREPNRPVVQDCMPFRLCKEAQTPEMFEKLLHALNIHLKQTAELWHSWHHTTNTKFQWGSPIQVGLAKDNLDKKSLTNIESEQSQMEYTSKSNNERSNKRKSTLVLSSSTEQCSNDEDEKVIKKQKVRSHEDTNKVSYFHKDVNTVISNEKDQNLSNDSVDSDFDCIEIDNCEIEPKRKAEERLSPELGSLYPRKIMPPNVRKSINKKKEHTISMSPICSVAHSTNKEQSAISSMSKEKSKILSDEEILEELEKDNMHDNIKATSENVTIKPLPIRGLSRRIKNQCMVLEKIKLEKQKKVEIEKEEAQKKENDEKRKREEFYKKQISETQRREKQKEEEEKLREKKSKKWNNLVDTKSQKKTGKDSREKLPNVHTQDKNKFSERAEENRMLQENSTYMMDNIEIIENDLANSINCPICNKSFPADEIETHAAECEQYTTENECENSLHLENEITPRSSNSTEMFECNICSKFRTASGIDYEDHVNSCLQRHEEQSAHEHTSAGINVPNSPIRCYRPISEQTDSYIDYKKQFILNNKAQAHSSKKRKR